MGRDPNEQITLFISRTGRTAAARSSSLLGDEDAWFMTWGTQDRTSIPVSTSPAFRSVSVQFVRFRLSYRLRSVLNSLHNTPLPHPLLFTTSVSPLARMSLPIVVLSYCWPCRSFLSDQFSSEDHWTTVDAKELPDLTVYQWHDFIFQIFVLFVMCERISLWHQERNNIHTQEYQKKNCLLD